MNFHGIVNVTKSGGNRPPESQVKNMVNYTQNVYGVHLSDDSGVDENFKRVGMYLCRLHGITVEFNDKEF